MHKYVAFGQLIDGESTLQKIENVETWYESPLSKIEIYRAGILNLDCQDIMINRGAKEYIHSHIEDLLALGELLIEVCVLVLRTGFLTGNRSKIVVSFPGANVESLFRN